MGTARRDFLAAAVSLPFAWVNDPVLLIAHRGGVVDTTRPENSAAAVDEAIARNYWMIEVDVRRTRDGSPVLQHDPTFERDYGDPRRVDALSWPEIASLRSAPGGRSPLSFEETCVRCAGRTRLMLDIKGSDHPEAFHETLARLLATYGLLETAYVLSSGGRPGYWYGKAKLAANAAELRAAIARSEDVATKYVLFGVGATLDAADVVSAQQHGVSVVAALNTFRYDLAGVDHHAGAQADADRLLALGVRQFQIDSVYEPYLRR